MIQYYYSNRERVILWLAVLPQKENAKNWRDLIVRFLQAANTKKSVVKRKNLLQDLLAWEKINYGYEKCAAKYSDTPSKATQEALEELKNNKEKIEMELQCSNMLLTTDGHIAVRILPPNFFD